MIQVLIWEDGARTCLHRLSRSSAAAHKRGENLFRDGLQELTWHTATINAGEEHPWGNENICAAAEERAFERCWSHRSEKVWTWYDEGNQRSRIPVTASLKAALPIHTSDLSPSIPGLMEDKVNLRSVYTSKRPSFPFKTPYFAGSFPLIRQKCVSDVCVCVF